ncbi:MAG: hypothetical protein HZA01_04935 [Nitrospinae bacterium]|nr:hypothetical protein [Nitrospinota bacterium]
MEIFLIITGLVLVVGFGLWKRSSKIGPIKITDEGMKEIHRLEHEERD